MNRKTEVGDIIVDLNIWPRCPLPGEMQILAEVIEVEEDGFTVNYPPSLKTSVYLTGGERKPYKLLNKQQGKAWRFADKKLDPY